MDISVVIPMYGCRAAVQELHKRLCENLEKITSSYEIIMVDDCCPQNSWEEIVKVCEKDKKVKGIHLSKNFGQIAMADNLFVNYIVDTICQISFIALMLVFVQKYNIKSRVSIAIASISYEVYLTHQLGLDAAKFLFGNTFDAIIIFIGIVISLIMGYVLNKALFIIWVRRK